jgi:hypothetical protein
MLLLKPDPADIALWCDRNGPFGVLMFSFVAEQGAIRRAIQALEQVTEAIQPHIQ